MPEYTQTTRDCKENLPQSFDQSFDQWISFDDTLTEAIDVMVAACPDSRNKNDLEEAA
jgi:hypothetical protein